MYDVYYQYCRQMSYAKRFNTHFVQFCGFMINSNLIFSYVLFNETVFILAEFVDNYYTYKVKISQIYI